MLIHSHVNTCMCLLLGYITSDNLGGLTGLSNLAVLFLGSKTCFLNFMSAIVRNKKQLTLSSYL